MGQCYADSLPFLLISAEPKSESLGKGQGVLHEITDSLAALYVQLMDSVTKETHKAIFFKYYIFTTTLPVDFRFLINSKAAVVSENGYM